MGGHDVVATLAVWTPYLAAGFALNLAVTGAAMVLGTLGGYALGRLRWQGGAIATRMALAATSLFRNVPMFVFLYYIAFILPPEVRVLGALVAVPPIAKAVVTFTIPVAAATSDHFRKLFADRAHGVAKPFNIFVVNWTQYLLLMLMGSSTASVIGVNEIVGRANTIVTVLGEPALTAWIYAYVALWFIAAGAGMSALLRRTKA